MTGLLGPALAVLAAILILAATLYLSLPRLAWWLYRRRVMLDA